MLAAVGFKFERAAAGLVQAFADPHDAVSDDSAASRDRPFLHEVRGRVLTQPRDEPAARGVKLAPPGKAKVIKVIDVGRARSDGLFSRAFTMSFSGAGDTAK